MRKLKIIASIILAVSFYCALPHGRGLETGLLTQTSYLGFTTSLIIYMMAVIV